MIDRADAYLEAARAVPVLLADPAIAAAWEGPSALAEFSVRGLAGHLASQISHVSRVLEAGASELEPVGALEFFSRAAAFGVDVDHEANVRIRRFGEAAAADGARALIERIEAALPDQHTALSHAPADQVISFLGIPLLLNDFLLTRLVEIVVHTDDLAVSIGIETPSFPPRIFEPVLDLLTRSAVARHGQPAVLRALTRAERAPETITAF